METPTWLTCHNKFITAENVTILSVSSNDILHDILEGQRPKKEGVDYSWDSE